MNDRMYVVDRHDPVALAKRRLRRLARNVALSVVFAGLFLCLVGVPHVCWTYQYRVIPGGKHMLNGDYWSVTGWRKVRAGQYGKGCPFLIFVPLRDVVDFSTFSLKGLFHV